MIPSDDKVRNSVVLAHLGVEYGLAGPRVAHPRRKPREQRMIRRIVLAEQDLVAGEAHLRRRVVVLGFP